MGRLPFLRYRTRFGLANDSCVTHCFLLVSSDRTSASAVSGLGLKATASYGTVVRNHARNSLLNNPNGICSQSRLWSMYPACLHFISTPFTPFLAVVVCLTEFISRTRSPRLYLIVSLYGIGSPNVDVSTSQTNWTSLDSQNLIPAA